MEQETAEVSMENVTFDSSIDQVHIGKAYVMLSKVDEFKGKRIENMEKLIGGLTNENFKVTVGGMDVALRVAGEGTAAMIDRPAEDNNAHLMAEAEINPRLNYYDPVKGDKIDVYIDGKTLHIPDFQTEDADSYIKMIAKTLNKVHTGDFKFKGKFDFVEEVRKYCEIVKTNKIEMYEGHDKALAKLDEIEEIFAKNPRTFSPSHNDPLPENWIVKDEKIYLIDWEYGGIGDPLMDVAAFSLEVGLTDAQETLFLNEYFGRKVTDKEYAYILINKFINDVLWYMWAPIQIFNGKPKDWYWEYGLNRFNRAIDLINSDLFNKYIVLLK